jgi:guanosine-3',5'-bis(diphosphate) 3'-pyrophosphohydrolase
LKMAITGKARSKIRSAMKEERRRIGEYGKEALERKLKNLKIDFEENVDIISKHLGFKSRADFFYALSQDDVRIGDIKNYVIEGGKIIFKKEEETDSKPAPIVEELKKIQRPAKSNRSSILVNGEPADIYQYSLATCCNPVHGDEIFAYLTSNQGLKIHRTSCSNATHLLANYGYRVLKADWEDYANASFVVELLVTGIDSGPGVIQALTNELSSKLGINIKSFSIEGKEGYFEGRIGIIVLNKDQLNLVIQSLEKLPGISSVVRTDRTIK